MSFDVHLYFSGYALEIVNSFLVDNNAYRLATFAYPKEAHEYLNLANERGKQVDMIIDSGAFTAWNVGKPVQLQDLIAYNDDIINTYGPQGHRFNFISLDVIPGDRGRKPTADELFRSVEKSKDNFATLQQHFAGRGEVLPVYHSGEDVALRDYYMSKTNYLCLSMDQTMSESSRVGWASRSCMDSVIEGGDYKYHGLAATGNRMVTEVPWYSVDSSSWITVSGMGGILWPTSAKRFKVLPCSTENPTRHEAGKHLHTLTLHERERCEDYIKSWGYDPEKLSLDYNYRRVWNCHMWLAPPWERKLTKDADLFEGLS